MSDVYNAPAPPANTPAPAPTQEVTVDIHPVSPPAPVSNQAPEKPAEPPRQRPSRAETIKAAFDKHEKERPKPKPAEARMGHNQPPELTEPELNLKKRPEDQPRERGEGGRFAPRAQEAQQYQSLDQHGRPIPRSGQTGQDEQPRQVQQLPETAPYRQPLPRMHAQAQAEWHAAPESVRGEVHRMAREFTQAYQQQAADVQEMNSIRKYQQMAQKHGTTLEKALTNYTGMEELLRTDLVAGLDLIVNNLKLRSPEGQPLGIRDVAWHVLNQTPEQHQIIQSQNAQMAQTHQLAQTQQRLQQLEYQQQQAYAQQRFVYARSAVDAFAAQYPRFDELSEGTYYELLQGHPLDVAYRRAELLYGSTQAAQTRAPTAQTRPPDRSISGGPDSPMNGTARRNKPVPSRRDAVADALKQVTGSY